MAKASAKQERTPKGREGSKVPAPNPQLNTQTRKLLTKHYRAKHGVR
jgi:hypothetical protein